MNPGVKGCSNTRLPTIRCGLALLFSVTLFAAPPPSVILSRDDGHPIFISASAMVNTDGTAAAVVPKDWRPGLQRLAEVFSKHGAQVSALSPSTTAPCLGGMLSESPAELWVDRSTRHSAVVSAHAIVTGTIRSVTPGFFHGQPASLIELDHLDKIKAGGIDNVRDTLYVRLPYAQFVVGGVEYCREPGTSPTWVTAFWCSLISLRGIRPARSFTPHRVKSSDSQVAARSKYPSLFRSSTIRRQRSERLRPAFAQSSLTPTCLHCRDGSAQ
jgi:hypothetical protein